MKREGGKKTMSEEMAVYEVASATALTVALKPSELPPAVLKEFLHE